jgi:hypothetical protein
LILNGLCVDFERGAGGGGGGVVEVLLHALCTEWFSLIFSFRGGGGGRIGWPGLVANIKKNSNGRVLLIIGIKQLDITALSKDEIKKLALLFLQQAIVIRFVLK